MHSVELLPALLALLREALKDGLAEQEEEGEEGSSCGDDSDEGLGWS